MAWNKAAHKLDVQLHVGSSWPEKLYHSLTLGESEWQLEDHFQNIHNSILYLLALKRGCLFQEWIPKATECCSFYKLFLQFFNCLSKLFKKYQCNFFVLISTVSFFTLASENFNDCEWYNPNLLLRQNFTQHGWKSRMKGNLVTVDTVISLPHCKIQIHLVNVVALVYVKCRVIYRGHRGDTRIKRKLFLWRPESKKEKTNLKTPEIEYEVNKIRKARMWGELQLASREASQEEKIW